MANDTIVNGSDEQLVNVNAGGTTATLTLT
jgi:hypothetical protein